MFVYNNVFVIIILVPIFTIRSISSYSHIYLRSKFPDSHSHRLSHITPLVILMAIVVCEAGRRLLY